MTVRQIFTMIFGALTGFILASDFSALSVALPSIAGQEWVAAADLSLIGSASTLAAASFMILGGRMADLYGPIRICLVGLAVYSVGCAIGVTATSATAIIVARAVQGFAFALLGPAGFSMLRSQLLDSRLRDRGPGIYAASTQGAGLIVGSVVGGLVTTTFGWRAVFLMNVPTVIIAVILALVLLHRVPERARPGSLDWVSAMLLAAATAFLMWSFNHIGAEGPGSPRVLGAMAAGIVASVLFIIYNRSQTNPLVPLDIFNEPRMVANILAMSGVMAAAAALYVLPNFTMQRIMGFTAAESGVGMLPQSLTNLVTGAILAYAIGRFTFRQNISVASIGYIAGLSLFVLLPMIWPDGGYPLLIGVPLVIASFGIEFSVFSILANSTSSLSDDRQGIVTSVIMSVQQVAFSIGIAVALGLAASGEALGGDVAALRYANLAGVAFAVAAALFALFGHGGKGQQESTEKPIGQV